MTMLLMFLVIGILLCGWDLCDYPVNMSALFGLVSCSVGAGIVATRILT